MRFYELQQNLSWKENARWPICEVVGTRLCRYGTESCAVRGRLDKSIEGGEGSELYYGGSY